MQVCQTSNLLHWRAAAHVLGQCVLVSRPHEPHWSCWILRHAYTASAHVDTQRGDRIRDALHDPSCSGRVWEMARDSQTSSPAKAQPPGKRAETTLKDLQARHASMGTRRGSLRCLGVGRPAVHCGQGNNDILLTGIAPIDSSRRDMPKFRVSFISFPR